MLRVAFDLFGHTVLEFFPGDIVSFWEAQKWPKRRDFSLGPVDALIAIDADTLLGFVLGYVFVLDGGVAPRELVMPSLMSPATILQMPHKVRVVGVLAEDLRTAHLIAF